MADPDTSWEPVGFGLYLHIPFCSRRCDYCAFATWDDKAAVVDAYMAALFEEVVRATSEGLQSASTVFVGGGTPSLVPAEALARVIAAVPRTSDAEVTVECNPDNVNDALLAAYRDADDCVAEIAALLADDARRAQIAASGQARAIAAQNYYLRTGEIAALPQSDG